MNYSHTTLRDVFLFEPLSHGDERGWFSETFRQQWFDDIGFPRTFVQDNHSLSVQMNVLRGLHFQSSVAAQDKLIRCTAGSIFDVAVDIRTGSPTFGHWFGVTLSAHNRRQLLVPIGFAHGFLTLESNCQVQYKCSNYYSREYDCGLAWDDRDIAIDWPLNDASPLLSEKDANQPLIGDLAPVFAYSSVPFTVELLEGGSA